MEREQSNQTTDEAASIKKRAKGVCIQVGKYVRIFFTSLYNTIKNKYFIYRR